MKLGQGDVVSVRWLDIYEDSTGNPATAELVPRMSVGLFWEVKESHGVESLVTTTTIDDDCHDQNGFCIYPLECVLELQLVKRARKKREKKTKNA